MPTASDEITKTYSVPLAVTTGTLIDFETTGIPKVTQTHEVITLGYLERNNAVLIQRKTREKEPFYQSIRPIIERLPRPFYTYNSDFERDVISFELGMSVPSSDFVDLMGPWRAKAEEIYEKWPKLDELISEPEDYFRESKTTGAKIPTMWSWYLDGTAKEGILDLIIDHCLSDLLREAYLLLRYPFYGTRPTP